MTDEEPIPKCKGCQEEIDWDSVIQTSNAAWHLSCFRCSRCQNQLSTWYIEKAGRLLCRKDYWAKYRHLCNGCSIVISGPVMVAGEHRYHPECFQCCHCSVCIGQDEPYVLVERSALYCGHCYHSNVTRASEGETGDSTPPLLQPISPLATSSTTTTTTLATPSSSSSSSSSITSSVTLTITTTPMTNTAPFRTNSTKTRRIPHTIHMVKLPPSTAETHHTQQLQQQQQQQSSQHNAYNSPHTQLKGSDKENATNAEDHLNQCGLRLSIIRLGSNTDSGGSFQDGNHRHSFILEGGRMGPATRITSVDKSNTVLQDLEVGDCILEINGSSMRDRSLEEICDVICNRPSSVNIVVERDPNPIPIPVKERTDSLPSPTSPTSPLYENSKEGDTVIIDDTPVKLRNKRTLRARGHSPNRRRSKSPSPCPSTRQKVIDLSRSRSFTSQNFDHRVFRPTDLITGDILGQGFFGTAMKAKHKVTGENMVLKQLHNFDETAQKGFLMEVSMLRNLSHPCVLKFMGVLYRDKKLTLVTEFIDGGTLSDLLLNESVELSWIQRLKLVKDIANGMSYLHSMDVIHRDLNSGNCFVRKDQSVVVGDFGLAKIFPRHSISHLFPRLEEAKSDGKGGKTSRKRTTSRKKRQTVVGNPYWMAPEMVVAKGVYDEKVDIFSYGVIVFETIARVTADPDYLPRSLDLGVNVEAFHRRFCQHTPEPYTMLATLCSLIEPDRRPSFEEIEVLCESLHLHLEHGMSVPLELKGSTVELYRATKESLYGINYKDIDSVEDAEKQERKRAESKPAVPNNQDESNKDSIMNTKNEIESSSTNKTTIEMSMSDHKNNSTLPISNSSSTNFNLNSPKVYHSDSSSVISSGVHLPLDDHPEHSKLNRSFPAEVNSKVSSDPSLHLSSTPHLHHATNSSACDITGDDSTYFSCSSSSSLSPPASSSSMAKHNDEYTAQKPSSTNPCSSCLLENQLNLHSDETKKPQLSANTPSITTDSNIQQQQTQKQKPDSFPTQSETKENSLMNSLFHSKETDTEIRIQTETDVADNEPAQPSQPQSYFLHLDHCVLSDSTEIPESENVRNDSEHHIDIPETENQIRNSHSSSDKVTSSLVHNPETKISENINIQPSSSASSKSSENPTSISPGPSPSHPTHLNIHVDDDKSSSSKSLFLSLDRCNSPIHETYMCSSRSRQKRARNSMNFDQNSPNLSPQPRASLDWNKYISNASNDNSSA